MPAQKQKPSESAPLASSGGSGSSQALQQGDPRGLAWTAGQLVGPTQQKGEVYGAPGLMRGQKMVRAQGRSPKLSGKAGVTPVQQGSSSEGGAKASATATEGQEAPATTSAKSGKDLSALQGKAAAAGVDVDAVTQMLSGKGGKSAKQGLAQGKSAGATQAKAGKAGKSGGTGGQIDPATATSRGKPRLGPASDKLNASGKQQQQEPPKKGAGKYDHLSEEQKAALAASQGSGQGKSAKAGKSAGSSQGTGAKQGKADMASLAAAMGGQGALGGKAGSSGLDRKLAAVGGAGDLGGGRNKGGKGAAAGKAPSKDAKGLAGEGAGAKGAGAKGAGAKAALAGKDLSALLGGADLSQLGAKAGSKAGKSGKSTATQTGSTSKK